MRRNAIQPVLLLACLAVIGATGCQSAGLRFLSLIGLQKDPLVVALVADKQPASSDKPLATLNPFAPYSQLQAALGEELGRPIALDLCFPLQLEPSLNTGIFHLAIVSPIQYARLPNRERFTVIAVPTDQQGRLTRSALLVVKAGSPIKSVQDLRGQTVAFGPTEDCRTHHAALDLLAQHGLQKTDLALELLPIPGSLKHMPNARAVAQTVINASSHAGFIDEADWEKLPEHTEDRSEPARDRLCVVAETVGIPDRLLIASPKLDQQTWEKLHAFLLGADREHPEVLRPLRTAGYQAPTDELLTVCARLAKPEVPAETPAE